MTDVANLSLKVDATSVDAGTESLKKFKTAGSEAQSATAQMAEQVRAMEAAYKAEYVAANSATKATVDRTSATRAYTQATKEAKAATDQYGYAVRDAGMISAAGYRQMMGLDGATKALTNSTKEAAVAHGASNKAMKEAEEGAHKVITGFNGAAIQTSLFTRELLVLAREAGRGDFTRMAGSATILAQSVGLMEVLMTGLGVAILAVAAAIGVFVAGVVMGEQEVAKFNNSLTATANYAGMTADSFEDMAHRVAKSSDSSIGSAKEVISSLVASGKFTADTIELMATNAEKYARLTGQNAEEIIKGYEAMKGGVVRWAVKHEEVYHDLTLAQIDYINQLEKSGQHAQAEFQVQKDIADNIKDRLVPQYGTLQRVLHDTANAASEMWDKILGIGRPKTIDDQIAEAKQLIHAADTEYNNRTSGGRENNITLKAREQRLALLIMTKKGIEDEAAAASKAAQEEDDRIRKKYDNQYKREKATSTKRDLVADEQARLQAEIDGNRDLAEAYDLSTAAGFKAAAMKAALRDAAKTHGEAAKFEAQELLKAVTATEAQGSKDVDTLQRKTEAMKAANEIVERTGVSRAEANRIANEALQIDLLQAAADNASGKDKEYLLGLIQRRTQAVREYNDETARGALEDATLDQQRINDDLQVQLDLINKTNREREVELAILQAKRDLIKMGIKDTDSPGAKTYIDAKVAGVNKKNDLADGVGDAIKQQQFYLDNLDRMTDRTRSAAQDMANAWGGMGKALGDLTTTYQNYADSTAKMELDKAERLKKANGDKTKEAAIEHDYLQQSKQDRLQYYGDVAGAASEFFGKQTAAYKVLHGVEMAYRAYEMASSIASVAVKAAEAAGKIPLNSAITASNVAAGASAMFATLGPLGFPAVAAMLAVMAAVGFSSAGGGGASGANNVEQMQKSQGTGSVFGDSTAKSNSLQNSLEISQRNQNQMLEYNSQMTKSLKDIQSNIGTVANALIRTLSVNGGVSGNLGLGTNSSKAGGTTAWLSAGLSWLLPGLFGTTSKTTLNDQGLQFGDQTLSQILAGGIQGNTYAQTVTNTKKKFLGITYSNQNKTNDYTDDLSDELKTSLTALVASLKGGVLSAATALGIKGADALLDAFTVSIGTVSFKDMTGQEISDTLNAIFSKVGDDMAATILPAITTFQKAGEGAMETLTRVARDYQVVDVSLQAIGKTFNGIGVSSIAAREHLVGLFDSLDDFVEKTTFYQEHFLTDAEQLAPVQAQLDKTMAALGLGAVKTRDGFKQLISGLDVSTVGGSELYAQLMNLAPAFDKVASATEAANQAARDAAQQAVDDAKKQVDTARSNLTSAYQRESQALQDVINKYKALNEQFKKYATQLDTGPQAALSPQDQYFASKSLFDSTYTRAQNGDQEALNNLTTVSDAYLAASKDYYASSQGYFDDLTRVKDAVGKMAQYTQKQVDTAQAAQDALDTMVNGFATANGLLFTVSNGVVTMNDTLLSVKDAISALAQAQGALVAAQTAQQTLLQQQADAAAAAAAAQQQAILDALNKANGTPTSGTATGGTGAANDNGKTDWNSYLTHYSDVQAEYQRNLLSGKGRAYLSQLGISSATDFAQWHYNQYGKAEGRTPYANGGIMTKPITLGNSGIGGEAGPEGILPLANVNGRLGVRAANDDETKELLKQLVGLMSQANAQRANANDMQIEKLDEVVGKLDATKRVNRVATGR